MSGKRIKLFDLAKLIAIIAVIVSHTAIRFLSDPLAGSGSQTLLAVCFTFHLPLFFIVSGYFLHTDRPLNLKREIRQLFPPYVLTCFVVICGMVLVNIIQGGVVSNRVLLLDWINASIFGAGDLVPNPLWPQTARIGAIWFILALFWARLLVSISLKFRFPSVVICVSFFIGMLSSQAVFLPFSIQPGMTSALFVYLGVILRRLSIFKSGSSDCILPVHSHRLAKSITVVVCLITWLYSVFSYAGFSMATNGYGSTPFDCLRNICGGIAGTLLILIICAHIEKMIGTSKFIQIAAKVGSLTLLTLCLHLVEDNVLPWQQIVSECSTYLAFNGSWLIIAGVRVVVLLLITCVLSKVNFVRSVFGINKSALNSNVISKFAPRFVPGCILIWMTVLLLFWIPYAISFYPGIVEIDSAFQLGEAIGLGIGGDSAPGSWTSLFPYGTALLMGGLFSIGTSLFHSQVLGIAFISAFQMLLLAIALSFSICYLEKWNVPLSVRYVAAAVVALNPALAVQVVTIGKDPLFSVGIVFAAVCVAESVRDSASYRSSMPWIALASLSAAYMVFTRSSGALIVLAVWAFPLLRFLFSGAKEAKHCFQSAACYIAPILFAGIALFVNGQFSKAHNVTDSTSVREITGTMMQQTTAAYRNNPDNLSEDENESLSEFYDIETAALLFEPQMNDQVKVQIYPNPTSSQLIGFIKDWACIGFRYPGVYLYTWYQLVSGYIMFGDFDALALPRFIPTQDAMNVLGTEYVDGVDINGDSVEVTRVLLDTNSPYSAGLLPEYSEKYSWFGDWEMPDDTIAARKLILLGIAKIGSIPLLGWLVSKPLFVFWAPIALLLVWLFRRNVIPLSVLVPLGCMSVLALLGPVDLTRYCFPSMALLPLSSSLVLSGRAFRRDI